MLKPIIMALALLTAASPALANSQKLPFVGARTISSGWDHTMGYDITISKNGNTTVSVVAAGGSAKSTLYKGKYRPIIPLYNINKDYSNDMGPDYYYLQIKNNKGYFLDRNKNLTYGCSLNDNSSLEEPPCIMPLIR